MDSDSICYPTSYSADFKKDVAQFLLFLEIGTIPQVAAIMSYFIFSGFKGDASKIGSYAFHQKEKKCE